MNSDRNSDKTPTREEEIERLYQRVAVLEAQVAQSREAEAIARGAFGKLERQVELRTAELLEANERLRREIRERGLAEEELRRVTGAIPHYLWSAEVDAEGVVSHRYYSPVVEKITGRPPEFFMEDPHAWLSIVHPDDRPGLQEAVGRLVAGEGEHDTAEYRVVWPDGTVRWVQDCATVTPLPGGGIRLDGVVSDITHRRQTEDEWVHLERVRALGEMAEGVAHNFNNLLVGVLGYAQLIQLKTDNPEIDQDAERIVESALRAKELVRRLNVAVSGTDRNKGPVEVGDVILATVESTRPRWKDEPESRGVAIQMTTNLEPVSPVAGSVDGLQDVLVNLIRNAVDAMPDGGTITISARPAGGSVRVVVADTGVGMEARVVRRVFEPFFTTKATVGVGLGLSVVHGIVTGWGGRVEIESTPGQGTSVVLFLPAWQVPAPPAPAPGTQERSPAQPGGRVLVVDDDWDVRELLSHMLKNYRVETAADGQEALRAMASGTYDVAMIDLGMPGMSGDQLAREVRRLNPATATVLITGWSMPVDDARQTPFDFKVEKPFRMEEVQDVLGRAMAVYRQRMVGM